jgi:hypothetical protein
VGQRVGWGGGWWWLQSLCRRPSVTPLPPLRPPPLHSPPHTPPLKPSSFSENRELRKKLEDLKVALTAASAKEKHILLLQEEAVRARRHGQPVHAV